MGQRNTPASSPPPRRVGAKIGRPLDGTASANERSAGDLEGKLALPDAFFRPRTDAKAGDWEG